MVQRTSPALYHAFRLIQVSLRSGCPANFVDHLYEVIPDVNFSSGICEPLTSRLCVLPVDDVGWSDWGTVGSIVRTVQKLGSFDTLAARMEKSQIQPLWHAAQPSTGRSDLPRRPAASTSPASG
jgi:hypothetical protein